MPYRRLSLLLPYLLLCRITMAAEATSSFSFPVIDIQAWTNPSQDNKAARLDVAASIQKACEEIGFFAIQNHGVNTTIIDSLWKASKEFFDLPLEEKLQSKTKNESEYPYGYERSETLVAGKSLDYDRTKEEEAPPDWKETYAIGPDNPAAGMPPRKYPPRPKELEPALQLYFKEMEQLSSTLLQIFATALQLPPHWFEDKMDHHLSALRLVNYWETTASAKQGQWRAGAHTDYGALTILKSGGPGLQVLRPTDHRWVDVPTIPDTFVVNLGDLMQRWTNDRWVSTLHRVVLMETINPRRQSVAYFCNINGDAPVETLETCISKEHPQKYPTILAKDHLMAKHLASMGVTDGKEDVREEL